MREKVRDRGRLEHILMCIQNLYEFTEGISYSDYTDNKMRRFAIVKNLEIIGEAAYMITDEFKSTHKNIEWTPIVKMRHVLVHGYYQISDEVVWEIIHNELQPLEQNVRACLKDMPEEE